MNGFPQHANVVIIGAGIVGNSMAYHLARLGWKDIVLLDKGPLPNPGGSTGHASNSIFLVDHSKEMTKFTLDSVRQYKELGVFTPSGAIEVARTPERLPKRVDLDAYRAQLHDQLRASTDRLMGLPEKLRAVDAIGAHKRAGG